MAYSFKIQASAIVLAIGEASGRMIATVMTADANTCEIVLFSFSGFGNILADGGFLGF